ncbi:hypothetical protein FACS1894195_0490 [Bacteroidia bacterium]|nr:hypothetical protein FACS1894195_0490 [Bacteroidia bacterium]
MKRERKAADFGRCNMVEDWKPFRGKAIYNPSGKAGEYSYWGCNFYVGCSCGCQYCFNKKGRSSAILGGDKPMLKKQFKDENHALEIFVNEAIRNYTELREHGLFFSFTSDPQLPDTKYLNNKAILFCLQHGIPVKILTKRIDCVDSWIILMKDNPEMKQNLAYGFTLTGHDELEQNASTNAERIEAMRRLHDACFKTFASIEPIIDCDSSVEMIWETLPFCDLYKIGLESGKKYNKDELLDLISEVIRKSYLPTNHFKIYFKDSLLKQAGINREDLPVNCVSRDYNMFN